MWPNRTLSHQPRIRDLSGVCTKHTEYQRGQGVSHIEAVTKCGHFLDHSFKYICLNENVWISLNTLRLRQNGCHFANDSLKWIFLNENVWISLQISLKFVPKVSINKILSLVWIMAWRSPGNKPLSEPMIVSLPMHICVTRPQWVKISLKFVPKVRINNIPSLVQIMAWRRPGDKPLSEPMIDYWCIYAPLGLTELNMKTVST